MKAPFNLTCLSFILVFVWISCTKQSDLEKIPDSSLLVLGTVADAQALLDNISVMRETPVLPELSADDLYLLDTGYLPVIPVELNAYLWEPDIFQGQKLAGDWFNPYQQVYYANSVISAIPRLNTASQEQLNNINGSALFIRAYAFHNVATEFANLYNKATSEVDPGIPLRLTSDPLTQSTRATVKETYERILRDAKDAAALLQPQPDPKRKNRPCAAAAFALIARTYLSMRDYLSAKLYADSSLMLYSALIDYNNINPATINPFSPNNEEVLYQTNLLSTSSVFYPGGCFIDTNLYRSFSEHDLRKQLFFSVDNTGQPVPGFSYSGDITRFSGLAVDEVLLIRAECNVRLGSTAEAFADLNILLKARWKSGTYIPLIAGSPNDALQVVLQERRKELVFRGLRWTDIRRLNMEKPSITLKRLFKGLEYTLPPGDKRYVMPIPPDVIAINTNISQNPR